MANMQGKNRFPVDAANIIRDESAAAITATGATSAVALDKLTSYWDSGVNAGPQQVALVLIVTALDTAGGDEAYEAQVQVGTGNAVVVASPITAVGTHVILVSREQIVAADPDADTMRINMVVTPGVGGASIDYWAYLAPVAGH